MMMTKCPKCGNAIELQGEIAEGQHVLCPYCETKFEYHARKPTVYNNQDDVKLSTAKFYTLRSLSVLCGILATWQFVTGWFNLPTFFRSSWNFFRPDTIILGDYRVLTPVLLLCIAKFILSFIFAKTSIFLWNKTKR